MKIMPWFYLLLSQVAAVACSAFFLGYGFFEGRWWIIVASVLSFITIVIFTFIADGLQSLRSRLKSSESHHFGLSTFGQRFTTCVGCIGLGSGFVLMFGSFFLDRGTQSILGFFIVTCIVALGLKIEKLSNYLNGYQDEILEETKGGKP